MGGFQLTWPLMETRIFTTILERLTYQAIQISTKRLLPSRVFENTRIVLFLEMRFLTSLACLIRANKAHAEWEIQSCLSVDDYFKGSPPPSTSNHFGRWYPPQLVFVEINFDKSLNHLSAAGDFILWDCMDKLIKAWAVNYKNTLTLLVEARALRDWINLAVQAAFNKIITEGDSLIIIQALKGNIQVPWKISNIIKDLKTWLN